MPGCYSSQGETAASARDRRAGLRRRPRGRGPVDRSATERLRFVARLLDGEKMAPLCAEFGISRKTGYKIYHHYKGCGIDGLTDRSRRPQRYANQLPEAIEKLIVRLKREYPTWGAPKIRDRLQRRHSIRPCPAISTVHAVLDRHGLVTRRNRSGECCRTQAPDTGAPFPGLSRHTLATTSWGIRDP